MDDLYVESFFHIKNDSPSTIIKEQFPKDMIPISNTLENISKILLFFRLLQQDCELLLQKAPYLELSLKKVEKAIDLNQYSEALLLMEDLEELLDIAYFHST